MLKTTSVLVKEGYYLALLVGQWLYKYISQRTTMKTAERAIYLLLLLGGSILLIGNFVELVK